MVADSVLLKIEEETMMLKFICYPKCTTCQKAKKWLEDNKIEYELRDIKAENPTLEELTAWYKQSGLPLKKFFNTSGLLYKSMELKDKLPTMSEEDQLKLLATDGMLVKRPLVIGEDFALVGFKESEWNEIIFKGARQNIAGNVMENIASPISAEEL
jgi:arsenate reductase